MDFTCIVARSDLEEVVGSQVLGSMLKSIEAFDHHCVELLALARVAVLGTTGLDGQRRSCVVGGSAGFATAPRPDRLDVELPAGLDAVAGAGVGMLFLVPGLGETLRVNGHLRDDGSGVDVAEVYVHCAKAILRSDLWSGAAPHVGAAPSLEQLDPGPITSEVRAHLQRSPFVVLTSADGQSAADASPKGDPPGFVQVLDGSTIALPDRPGNRRTDTFHNLVEAPSIGLLAMVPGDDRVVELRGTARLTVDQNLRASMQVRGRQPKIALVIDVQYAALVHSAALTTADLWNVEANIDPSTLPKMTEVWADHVRANRQRGVAAAAIRKAVSARVLDRAIASDYENNLY